MSDAAGLALAAVVLLLVASGWLALFLCDRSRLSAARENRVGVHGDEARIPLVAAFSGWKGVPWISWSSSDLNPALVLHPDHIECRVVRTRTRSYEAVSRVDYRETLGTNAIVLEFSDSLSSFVGNTASRELTRDAVFRLAQKGCPLSPRARRLLEA